MITKEEYGIFVLCVLSMQIDFNLTRKKSFI